MGWKGLLPRTLKEAGVTTNGAVTKIPYFRPDGELFRERFKMTDGKTWWGEGDGLLPYGLETLPEPARAAKSVLLICEGESDTLCLREVLRESFPYVFTIGCPGALAWKESWLTYVQDFKYVMILGDGDVAGDNFASKTQELIPRSIGWTLPRGEDVRSMIQEIGADELMDVVRESCELEAMLRLYFPPS